VRTEPAARQLTETRLTGATSSEKVKGKSCKTTVDRSSRSWQLLKFS
jgi:hypothetical protein